MIEVNAEFFKGARKVTCAEAKELDKQNKLVKVWWRPDEFINYFCPDEDVAYIWEIKE